MIELLLFLLKRKNYLEYRKYLPSTTEPVLKKIYLFVDTLMEQLNRDISFDEFYTFVLCSLPNITKRDKDEIEIAKVLLERARLSDIGKDAAELLFDDLQRKSNAFKLAESYLEYSEGRKSHEELQADLLSFSVDNSNCKPVEYISNDLVEIYSTCVSEQGLRWRLDCLNKSLGSLRKGDFGFVFARPESGKTTFLASEVSHMITQTEGDIIWINNEEQGNKVMLRVYESFFGKSLRELSFDLCGYKERFQTEIGSRLKIYDNASVSHFEIEKILSETSPALLVIDQLDKVKGFSADRPDLVFGRIYQWARELSKKYCPVIGICQASGDGEGTKWLTMDHVAEAKTSKQAESDFILGIGKTHDSALEFVRHLNISKNKLVGDEDTDPSAKHGRFDVIIEPLIARYKDIT